MRRPKAWVIGVFAALAISFLSSCQTYAVAKKEIFPSAKALVMAAGPDLFGALLGDLGSLIGWPVDKAETLVGYLGPKDAPPAPAK